MLSTCLVALQKALFLPSPASGIHAPITRMVVMQLPEAERRGIPHHLIDILDMHEDFSAGDFFARARAATAEILQVTSTPQQGGS